LSGVGVVLPSVFAAAVLAETLLPPLTLLLSLPPSLLLKPPLPPLLQYPVVVRVVVVVNVTPVKAPRPLLYPE